jgi:electron transfer flavoprotein alpha subunit
MWSGYSKGDDDMKKFLVFIEQKGEEPRKVSLEILSEIRKLAGSIEIVIEAVSVGDPVDNIKNRVLPYVNRFVQISGAGLDSYTAEGFAAAVAVYVQESKPDVILAGATMAGRDFFPRLAVIIGSGIASDVTEIHVQDGAVRFVRPLYGGKVLSEVMFADSPVLATIRPNAFPMAEPGENNGEFIERTIDLSQAIKTRVVRIEKQAKKKADLSEADVIVSGGRGMKAAENFQVLDDLSDVINATVGASRSVVDAKWRDQEDQVGKSGKTVSPKLYIAAGISGAIHHIMGMDTSKVIVAINKDSNAIIFNYADYGIVGDAMEVIPAMIEELKSRMGK